MIGLIRLQRANFVDELEEMSMTIRIHSLARAHPLIDQPHVR